MQVECSNNGDGGTGDEKVGRVEALIIAINTMSQKGGENKEACKQLTSKATSVPAAIGKLLIKGAKVRTCADNAATLVNVL